MGGDVGCDVSGNTLFYTTVLEVRQRDKLRCWDVCLKKKGKWSTYFHSESVPFTGVPRDVELTRDLSGIPDQFCVTRPEVKLKD